MNNLIGDAEMNLSFDNVLSKVGLIAGLAVFLYSGTAMSNPAPCTNRMVRSFPMKPPVKQGADIKSSALRGPDADLLNLRFEPTQKSKNKVSGMAVRKASLKKHSVR